MRCVSLCVRRRTPLSLLSPDYYYYLKRPSEVQKRKRVEGAGLYTTLLDRAIVVTTTHSTWTYGK